MSLQFILKPIFSFVWKKRLRDYKLVKVKGFRSCLMDSKYGQRIRATFLFGNYKCLNRNPDNFMLQRFDTRNVIEKNVNDTLIRGEWL